MSQLVALSRSRSGKMALLHGSSGNITSERNIDAANATILSGVWNPDKVVSIVPLRVESVDAKSTATTADFELLPVHLQEVLRGGLLRTSQTSQSDYSVLMVHSTNFEPVEGRTGALLYKGEPVVVSVNGKDFVVEIKGVGTYDGNNRRESAVIRSSYLTQTVSLCGSMSDHSGMCEFANLEYMRAGAMGLFRSGNTPRAVQLTTYSTDVEYGYPFERTDQAYLVRLAPGTRRASFTGNDAFEEDDPVKMAQSVATNLAQLIILPQVLIARVHPENLVRLANGSYSITDLSDCTSLFDLDDPRGHFLKHNVMTRFFETSGLTEEARQVFATTLADSLGLKFKEGDDINSLLWLKLFAPMYYQAKGTVLDKEGDLRAIADLYPQIDAEQARMILGMVSHSLQKEADFLTDVADPELQQRIDALRSSVRSINFMGLLHDDEFSHMTSAEAFREFYP